jgi:hypothetical protein
VKYRGETSEKEASNMNDRGVCCTVQRPGQHPRGDLRLGVSKEVLLKAGLPISSCTPCAAQILQEDASKSRRWADHVAQDPNDSQLGVEASSRLQWRFRGERNSIFMQNTTDSGSACYLLGIWSALEAEIHHQLSSSLFELAL